jgi:hypothetical protein
MARTREKTINAIFGRYILENAKSARRIFQKVFFDETFDALNEAFLNSFSQVKDEHPLNIADSWNYQNLQPRGSFQAPTTDRHRFEIRAPHMDSELVNFLLRIPPRSRIEQRIYKKMIAYGYPKIRSIPCTNSAKPVNPYFVSEYTAMTLRFLGGKIQNTVRPILSKRRRLGREASDLNQQVRAEPDIANKMLLPLLDQGVFPSTIFSIDGIRTLVNEQFGGHHDHAMLISLLLSWGIAAKFFLYDQLDDAPKLASLTAEGTTER